LLPHLDDVRWVQYRRVDLSHHKACGSDVQLRGLQKLGTPPIILLPWWPKSPWSRGAILP